MGVEMGAHYFQTNPHCGSLIPLRKMNNRDIRRAFQVPVEEKDHNLGSYWWKHRQHTEHLSRGGSSSSKSEIH